jgi:signal transduction histidine kinase
MILNLLDLSKGDEGKLVAKRSEGDPGALVEGILAELGAAAQARRIKLESNVEAARILADEDLLRRTIANLVENAVRHAATDTTVTVSVVPKEAHTEIRVTDRGLGVPSELRERVFDPFVQVEGNDRRPTRTGRGLGLAFCKLAVEAHGGTIWIEDASPGAVFCVSIPHVR